ncbi:MAG: hypothetical protein Q4A04_07230 [Eubacteriales bacterium]|nr:hypothetical protein [Eubacteriales bacterium]
MRKLTKVLVLVAAFTALFALTAFAKTGWASDENGWYYVGTDGEKVTEETRNSNGKIYYLGEDGYMVKNFAVRLGAEEKLYYFGEDGARVANQWVLLPAEDGDESGETERWYRFGSTGAALTGKEDNPVQKVGDSYFGFDTAGRMLFGFVNAQCEMINDAEDPICECTWYFGDSDDGVMKTEWVQYEGFTQETWESAWFYFKPKTGVKYVNGTYLINKKNYAFNTKGKMVTGWAAATPDDEEEDKLFWNDDGTKKTSGWVYATDLGNADAKAWYYLASGKASRAGEVSGIKSKYYAFAPDKTNPKMLSGLVYLEDKTDKDALCDIRNAKVATESDATVKKVAGKRSELIKDENKNLFYFSKNENAGGGVDGWALSGAVDVDFEDELVTLHFDKHNYRILHGKVGDSLYNYGRLQTADGYGLKKVSGVPYLVDAKGKVVTKDGKYKDVDGNYYVQKGTAKYFVANDEYEYVVKKTGKADETKYANASTVAKNLYDGKWDAMNPVKKAEVFANAYVAKEAGATSN